jgi:phage terminase large subunit-like protein
MASQLVYKPQWYQVSFHKSLAFVRSAFGGRHSGKSMAGVNEAIRAATVGIPGIPAPNIGLCVSPTKELLEGDLVPLFQQYLDYSLVKKFTKHTIVFTNGSVIHLRSGFKPDAVRGLHPNWAFIDEAAYLETGDVFQNILLGLQQGGRIWIASTPKGFNWAYYQLFLPWKTAVENGTIDDAQYVAYSWRSDMNQYRNQEMLDKIISAIPDEKRRRQELDAEFISYEGQVYKELDVEIVAAAPSYVEHVAIGFDWGYTHPSSFQVLGEREGVVYQLEEVMLYSATPLRVSEEAERLSAKYGWPRIFADPSAPGIIAEMMQFNPRIRVEKAMNDVPVGIGKVDDGFRTDKLKICNAPRFLEEKKGYHWIGDKVFKENDDSCDALRYGYCGIEIPDNSKIIIIIDTRTAEDFNVGIPLVRHDDITIEHSYGEW